MKPRLIINKLLAGFGYEILRIPDRPLYDEDGLRTDHNHSFIHDPEFQAAYRRNVQAYAGFDWKFRWRVHVGLWAASHAKRLPGDFVECGTNRGGMSSAIMQYLDWNNVGKHFYLLDTFKGIDERFTTERERANGIMNGSRRMLERGLYVKGADSVKANFAEWNNIHVIEGSVPETLSRVDAREVAYLHLDMNCAPPEVAAAEFFWERLVGGAMVLLDDYGFGGHEAQREAVDGFAATKQVKVLCLPTGQGLIVKPPR